MRVAIVTPPAAEPVTLAEAKTHARIDIDDDDALVSSLITAAREKCEAEIGQAFINTTFDLFLDNWPHDDLMRLKRELVLPRAPIVSVTSITYYDTSNALQTLDTTAYDVSLGLPGRIWRAFGQSWPILANKPDAVVIRFVAGYGATGASVPASIRAAIMMHVAHVYENRGESESEFSAATLTLLRSAAHGTYR